MQNLTTQCHNICQTVLKPGDVAIDATAGNGHDTLFLAQQVGSEGIVYAFDVQTSAIEATTLRIKQANLNNVILINEDHTCMQKFIPEKYHHRVAVVMFNLGYLPGGDKSLVTKSSSTISALEQSLKLLRSDGLLTVLAYTGHPGGEDEADAVSQLLSNLCDKCFTVKRIIAQKDSVSPPQLFVVQNIA